MKFSLKTSLAIAFGILAFTLFAFPQTARADSFTITSGHVSIGGAPHSIDEWSNVSFNFSGNGFAASGGASDSGRQGIHSPCAFDPCQPGATVFPNSTAFLDGPGAATFNGMTIGAWWFARDSVLSFSGPGVVIPNSTDPVIIITSPFVMNGSIFVHTLFGSIEHPVVFSTTISGTGIATMTLNLFPNLGSGGYIYSSVRYDFQSVPELTTLVLFATGAIGLAACYRPRSTKRRATRS